MCSDTLARQRRKKSAMENEEEEEEDEKDTEKQQQQFNNKLHVFLLKNISVNLVCISLLDVRSCAFGLHAVHAFVYMNLYGSICIVSHSVLLAIVARFIFHLFFSSFSSIQNESFPSEGEQTHTVVYGIAVVGHSGLVKRA